MPITIIVGGQFGSEGKGKVALHERRYSPNSINIRIGGPNSGHTVMMGDKAITLYHLPAASTIGYSNCVIGSGSYLNVPVLLKEIKDMVIGERQLTIDPKAVVITKYNKEEEVGLKKNIGSTGSGVGRALIGRIERNVSTIFADQIPELEPYIGPTIPMLRDALDEDRRIIIEGTQGYGLSLLHSEHYPFVTSRDTTAAGFLSEVGLSPLDVDKIILVIRTFPIRVKGNSGPLPYEISWKDIKNGNIKEYTSVTKQLRRVARFDAELVREAIASNNPTHIALNHLDYVKYPIAYANYIEEIIGREINYIGMGPDQLDKRTT